MRVLSKFPQLLRAAHTWRDGTRNEALGCFLTLAVKHSIMRRRMDNFFPAVHTAVIAFDDYVSQIRYVVLPH